MRYTKTYWQHQGANLPILYFSAFDDAHQEIYRVEVFASGEKLYADKSNTPEDKSYIYGISIEEVLAFNHPDGELFSVEISEHEFNRLWCVAENPKYHSSD